MTKRLENWQGMNWVRQTTRLALYLRDGLACAYCGVSAEDGGQLTLDHIKPHSKGGDNHTSNLVTCCHQCNTKRGNKSVAKFAQDRADHVRKCARRELKQYRQEARTLIARRGSVARVLASI
jgi:5-methylcytosine-specific restriction endonuclease McrA